jgi:hypothetical protein
MMTHFLSKLKMAGALGRTVILCAESSIIRLSVVPTSSANPVGPDCMNLSEVWIPRPIMALTLMAAIPFAISACNRGGQATADRRQVVEHCSSLIAQNRFREGAACLQPFEGETNSDAQTAAAQYQLGQLYENGRGVPADPDHALRLYRSAEKLRTQAPDIADRAGKSATQLINRMRQAEEP